MLVHSKTQKLVLNLQDPERVTTLIPEARILPYKGRDLVVVPHNLHNTRVLRDVGFPAPSPIEHYYNWSGQYAPFYAQKVTAGFLTLEKKSFVLSQMGCVDADTEYLSPTGWVRIADYVGGEVAQYHPDSGSVDFVKPTEYVRAPCDDMIRIKTKYGIDQLLSPEHRVLLEAKGSPGKHEVVQAETLLERHEMWLSHNKLRRDKRKIGWSQAAIPVTFTGPGGSGIALTDEELRVQIAVIADGHFPNATHTCTIRLKRERKIIRLRQLLDAAGITYRERTSTAPTAAGFRVFSFKAPLRDKEFGSAYWQATAAQMGVITEEVMHWDGSVSDNPSRGPRFSSTSKASADFVQYAFTSTGRTARVMWDPRGCYTVQVRNNGDSLYLCSVGSDGTRNRVMWREPPTDGFKYCFIVPSTFLIFRRNGCVFASGNTGKTLSCLWAFDYLRQQGLARKLLIVSPLSTLERTWADEVFMHFPHLTVGVLHGSKDKRAKLLANEFDVYLINHDGVKTIRDELVASDIDTVVIDEVATFRNSSAARWKALNAICKGRERIWGLTGTPTPNEPTDAWAQVKLINPDKVPKYFGAFRDTVMRKVGHFKWVPRDNAVDLVAEAMRPSVQFRREECVDLPECIYQTRQVPLSTEQAKAYKEMRQKLAFEVEQGQVVAVNEAVKLSKLLQICCGAAYDGQGGAVPLDVTGRVSEVIETIEQADGKVLVFVPFTAALNQIAAKLREQWEVGVIHGGTSKTERDNVFHAFQKGRDMRVLVANPATLSHGLTLTSANTIVWFGPPQSAEQYEQANARVTRPGQKLTQFIVHIEGTDVERKVYERLRGKRALQGLLLDVLKGT